MNSDYAEIRSLYIIDAAAAVLVVGLFGILGAVEQPEAIQVVAAVDKGTQCLTGGRPRRGAAAYATPLFATWLLGARVPWGAYDSRSVRAICRGLAPHSQLRYVRSFTFPFLALRYHDSACLGRRCPD